MATNDDYVDSLTASWKINNFSTITSDCILSPVFKTKYNTSTWYLKLRPFNVFDVENEYYVGVYLFAKSVHSKFNSIYARYTISITDNDGHAIIRNECQLPFGHKFIVKNDGYGSHYLVSRKLLNDHLLKVNDLLIIRINVDILKSAIFQVNKNSAADHCEKSIKPLYDNLDYEPLCSDAECLCANCKIISQLKKHTKRCKSKTNCIDCNHSILYRKLYAK